MKFFNEILFDDIECLKNLRKCKKELEEKGKVKVKINKNIVKVEGEEFYDVYKATNVIEAIKVGFDPKDALNLLDEEYTLLKIDVREAVGKNISHIRRVLSRIIGTKGKAKKIIQQISNAKIIIKGHDVYILGKIEEVEIARDAISRLIQGSPHSKVYHKAEQRRKELKVRKKLEELGILDFTF